MLSIGPMSGGQGRYYAELAREDYYINGGEPEGHWWGKGADALGIKGVVTGDHLEALFDGYTPDGKQLVQNAGSKDRRPGFDLTFSAPKSVSVMWATARDDVRREIQHAQDAAVKAALTYLEDEGLFVRTGKEGTHFHQARMVAALFEHATSRALDPQLHTHALLMNLGVMDDDRTRALVHTKIFPMKMVLGALYRAELAAQLEHRLGVTIDRDHENGFSFVVRGVVSEVCDFFSKRRAQIEEVLGKEGLESAKAAEIATKESRDIKDLIPARCDLFMQWRDQAAAFFFGAEQVHGLLGTSPVRNNSKAMHDAFHEALDVLEKSHSHFTRDELLQQVSEAAIGRGLNAANIREGFEQSLLEDKRLIHLGKDQKFQDRFATEAICAAERSMLKATDALAETKSHGVDAKMRLEVFKHYATSRSAFVEELGYHARGLLNAALKREPLDPVDRTSIKKESAFVVSAEQKDAVRYLTRRGEGDIRCLEGFAGTGKTSTLKVATEIFEKAGYKVIGTSLGGKAVEELRAGAGIVSYTYAMLTTLMKDHWLSATNRTLLKIGNVLGPDKTPIREPLKFTKKTVLVVDEAGMMDTHQICFLVNKIREAGGMILLVGDRDQLQAIGPGGAFAFIADRVGKTEINTIIRQRDERDRDVVHQVRNADAEAALESLKDRGLMTVSGTRSEALDRLAADWVKNEAKNPSASLVFVGTNRDAESLNERCQRGMKDAGMLRGDPLRLLGKEFYKGDRILLKETSRTFGVNNGDIGTLVGIQETRTDRILKVKLDRGKTVYLPLMKYFDLDLGYAVTTHKGQGSTVDRAYVLAGGSMQDKQISYVQVSRTRESTRIYASKHEVGEDMEVLARAMNRSREKTLAATVEKKHDDTIHQDETIRQRQRQRTG